MTFHPTLTARERILGIGNFGSGKTEAHLAIADRLQSSTEDGEPVPQCFVLDTEAKQATRRSLEAGYPHLKNVQCWKTSEWADYQKNVTKALSLCTRYENQYGEETSDDWLVIDMGGDAWGKVQEFYIEEVFGKDPDEFWFNARTSGKSGSPLDGRKDWGTINRLYYAWINKAIQFPGHVYVTAKAEPLNLDNDSKEVKELYGAYGVKAVGQKYLGFMFHSTLWFQQPKPGTYALTTIRDDHRELLEQAPCASFPVSYLMKTAKWRD